MSRVSCNGAEVRLDGLRHWTFSGNAMRAAAFAPAIPITAISPGPGRGRLRVGSRPGPTKGAVDRRRPAPTVGDSQRVAGRLDRLRRVTAKIDATRARVPGTAAETASCEVCVSRERAGRELRGWAARRLDVDEHAPFALRVSERDAVRDEVRRGWRGNSVRRNHRQMPEVTGIAVGVAGRLRVEAVPLADGARRNERRQYQQRRRNRCRRFQWHYGPTRPEAPRHRQGRGGCRWPEGHRPDGRPPAHRGRSRSASR